MNPEQTDAPIPEPIEAVCRRAAEGDREALEQVLGLHHRRLLGFVRRKIDARWFGKIEPEDILQEAYVEAFGSISGFRYDGDESFYHWMTRIIDNRFFSQIRHWQTRKRDASRDSRPRDASSGYQALLEQCLHETQTPSRIVHQADAQGALLSCMARLTDEQRLVVQRHFLNAETFGAIAGDLGRSEDSVRRMAHRALEELGCCMGRASHFLSRIA